MNVCTFVRVLTKYAILTAYRVSAPVNRGLGLASITTRQATALGSITQLAKRLAEVLYLTESIVAVLLFFK